MPDAATNGPKDPASRKDFWEEVHNRAEVDGVSWWQAVPGLLLGLVDETGVGRDRPIIDVGARWSTLVDHLTERGYRDLTAVDLSISALNTVRERLGMPARTWSSRSPTFWICGRPGASPCGTTGLSSTS